LKGSSWVLFERDVIKDIFVLDYGEHWWKLYRRYSLKGIVIKEYLFGIIENLIEGVQCRGSVSGSVSGSV
jgi:hypothetical protein